MAHISITLLQAKQDSDDDMEKKCSRDFETGHDDSARDLMRQYGRQKCVIVISNRLLTPLLYYPSPLQSKPYSNYNS